MEEKLKKLITFFDEELRMCRKQEQELHLDDRNDEAIFEKVKANVYDIFKTILNVAVKTGKGDSEKVKQFFLTKTEQIPTNWVLSYEQAKQHNDVEKMQIESIKLNTIQGIKEKFHEIWEEVA